MNRYKIKISEKLITTVKVEAETEFKAMEKAKEIYGEGEIILDKEDLEDTYFEIIEVQEIPLNEYETICILKSDTKAKDMDGIIKHMKENFKNIKEIEYLGIKKLAYEIQNSKEAYYLRAEMVGTSENVAKLEKYFRLNDNVLKFTIIKGE